MKRTLPILSLLLAGCAGNVIPAATVVPSTGAALSATKQIPVGKTPHGMGAAGGFVYNADVGDARLSVIDAATDAVVTTIPFPDGTPGYVKASHDGKVVYVADTKKGELVVIDPAQGHKVLQRVAVGTTPDKIRVEDGGRVLVSLVGEPKAVLLTFEADASKPPARRDLAVGAASGEHRDCALSDAWAVVPNPADNNVSLVNLVTNAVTTVTGGNNPGPAGIGMSGETAVAAIVGNAASSTISVFELPGGTATTIESTGLTPTDIAVDDQLGRAYVTMAGSNDLAVVDYVAKKLVGRVPVGNRPVHIYMAPVMPAAPAAFQLLDHPDEPVSHELWIGNDAGASVTVVDGESLRVKATVATDAGHHKMAFWGTKAYVSNITANNVSVIDRTTIQ